MPRRAADLQPEVKMTEFWGLNFSDKHLVRWWVILIIISIEIWNFLCLVWFKCCGGWWIFKNCLLRVEYTEYQCASELNDPHGAGDSIRTILHRETMVSKTGGTRCAAQKQIERELECRKPHKDGRLDFSACQGQRKERSQLFKRLFLEERKNGVGREVNRNWLTNSKREFSDD